MITVTISKHIYICTCIETVLLHGQGMTLIMKDKDNCIPNSQLFAYTPIMLQLPNGKTCSSRDLHTEEYESVGYRDGLHYSWRVYAKVIQVCFFRTAALFLLKRLLNGINFQYILGSIKFNWNNIECLVSNQYYSMESKITSRNRNGIR